MKNTSAMLLFSVIASFLLSWTGKFNKEDYVEVTKNKFVCIHEVTNEEYRAFLQDLQERKELDKLGIALYDSMQWNSKFPFAKNDPMVQMYHSHPAYNKYPVVNITRAGAELYCSWMTEVTNKDNAPNKKFRLATEAEWVSFADPLPGNNLPWYGSFAYEASDKLVMCANVKFKDYKKGGSDYVSDGCVYTCAGMRYRSNRVGVFDVIGNVAEMTSDDKIKGGSWDNFIEECTVDQSQKFTPPDPRVGFRIMYQTEVQ